MAFATPRTFLSAMKFLEENKANSKPFYLYVDTFHPHETWVAPDKYYQLYRDPKYKGKITFLNDKEAATAAAVNAGVVGRAWDLWKHKAMGGGR